MKKSFLNTVVCSCLIATITLTTGCTGLMGKNTTGKPLSKRMPWSKDKDKPEPYPNPTRMAATWTPDTLVQTGRTPTRGFGGRLFFYDEKTNAVPVDGELTVHAFAEDATGEQGEVKRYHFTAEQFTEHFSQTDLGASYSVWIPWDAVGGDQMRISLVPSFRAANGRLVQGEQAVVALPGKRTNVETVAARPNAAALMEAARQDGRSGLVTTTIPVHSQLTRPASVPLPDRSAQPNGVDAIAAAPKRTVQSFDVEPLALAKQTITPEDVAATQGNVKLAAKPFATKQRAPFGVSPIATRPHRLGQNASSSTQDVMRASATLPIE